MSVSLVLAAQHNVAARTIQHTKFYELFKTHMKVILDVRSNNQWKENSFIFFFKNNACQAIRENVPDIYKILFGSTEVKGVCSIKPGVYAVNNTPAQWSFPNFPIMPYGHYKYKVKLGRDENLIGWMAVIVGIIPKLD